MTSNARQSLRHLHAQQTRHLILESFAECLAENDSDDVSVRDIARRAGISDRTVYRHFPTRFELLSGLAEWTRTNFLGLIPLEQLDALGDVVTEAVRSFEARPELGRVMVRTALGNDLLSGLTAGIHAQLREVIDAELTDVSANDRRRLWGALSCLDSVHSWLTLHELEMSGEEISATLGWAISAVVSATRDAARPSTSTSTGTERS